jgi:hypothetical protein
MEAVGSWEDTLFYCFLQFGMGASTCAGSHFFWLWQLPPQWREPMPKAKISIWNPYLAYIVDALNPLLMSSLSSASGPVEKKIICFPHPFVHNADASLTSMA